MDHKDKSARDAFTLGLGGLRTISSFAIAPVIAHERLRPTRDGQGPDSRRQKQGLWFPRLFRAA